MGRFALKAGMKIYISSKERSTGTKLKQSFCDLLQSLTSLLSIWKEPPGNQEGVGCLSTILCNVALRKLTLGQEG